MIKISYQVVGKMDPDDLAGLARFLHSRTPYDSEIEIFAQVNADEVKIKVPIEASQALEPGPIECMPG